MVVQLVDLLVRIMEYLKYTILTHLISQIVSAVYYLNVSALFDLAWNKQMVPIIFDIKSY